MPRTPKSSVTRNEAKRTSRRLIVAAAVFTVAAAVGIAVSVADQADTPTAAPAPEPTGEVNAMGMPVVATPGRGTGTATAGPVEVTGARWELGRVPLDVAVRPSWVLHNTGLEPVTVGEPHPEVRAGCCPGAFEIDTTTIAPGATAELSFELSMHAGMDGWHDITVHVPLHDGTVEQLLEVGVTGDFTNT
jgi:hypothetical protein